MTPAHRRTAAQLADWMREAGMEAHIDAVGNVVGRYLSDQPDAKTLITGSHYDTVRDGGKYDGRLGILLPLAIVRHLHQRGERLPFHLEIVGFAEEEGVRFKSTFLGSNAIIGQFDMALLDAVDADGVSMRQALADAGHDVGRDRRHRAQSGRCAGLRRGAYRTGPGAARARPGARRGHGDRRQLALPGRADRPGQPRRHHADEHAQGRCRGRGRNRADGGAALQPGRVAGRHGRPAGGAEWVGECDSGPLQAVARYPRGRRCGAAGGGQGCARRRSRRSARGARSRRASGRWCRHRRRHARRG